MSHTINLLKPEEQHYHHQAETNPLFKVGGAALILGVIFWVSSVYQGHQEVIAYAQDLNQQWAVKEKASEDARKRRDSADWMKRTQSTLEGWGRTRYEWPHLLLRLREAIPEPMNMQLVRLDFDEQVEGIRKASPGQHVRNPPRRTGTVYLSGLVRGEQATRLVYDFADRLRSDPELAKLLAAVETLPIRPVGGMMQEDLENQRHEFQLVLTLAPRELK